MRSAMAGSLALVSGLAFVLCPAGRASASVLPGLAVGQAVVAASTGALGIIPGDGNADGSVDMVDLLSLVSAFGSRTGNAAYNAAADLNQDGSVDVIDLLGLLATFGKAVDGQHIILAYNDLGMHCMNQDFSEFMILPPYNVLHATVIGRGGEHPRLLTSGATVSYAVENNTHSADKTNFWQHARALLNVDLQPDVGLAGNGLSGAMVPSGSGRPDWVAAGIPVTPIDDSGQLNPYPLARISVTVNGQQEASTEAVVPVSWEIGCDLCHNTPEISTATDILRKHDQLHPQVNPPLEQRKPVSCGQCHAQAPLNAAGQPGVPSLSRAMHGSHASRMAPVAGQLGTACYACHPGRQTQCLRDVHFSKGMTCTDCHTSMAAVADAGRRPWVDEPRCGSCHHVAGHLFEQAGTLYRDSIGHNGVPCEVCHGSPHAITPTVVAADNVQAIAAQGHAGTIDTCLVCHTSRPDEGFNHSVGEAGD